MDIVSSVMDARQVNTPKKSSGRGWIIFAVVIFLLIWAVNAAGARDEQRQVQQATQQAQAAEALNVKCTNANFMNSHDAVTVPGRMEIVKSYYSPAGSSNTFNDAVYEKSYNAWMANGCD